MNHRTGLFLARFCISLVLFINLQCAIKFLFQPELFRLGFELSDTPGSAVVQGMGVLFIMWNVPYIFALCHPVRNRISMIETLIMQFIGVTGESILLSQLPGTHSQLHATTQRFILFDSFGFILLLTAFFITRKVTSNNPTKPVTPTNNC